MTRGPQPVAEHEAVDDIARVYHEIKRDLRVTGVNLTFRTWAGIDGFLPVLWDAMSEAVGTLALEGAADRVRATAAEAVLALGPPGARSAAGLGESQRHQLENALRLYHYVNPKLLVLTAALAEAFEGRAPRGGFTPPIQRGSPPSMAALEMVDEKPDDRMLRDVFADIRRKLRLQHVNSDYRTLALWPGYLEVAWAKLRALADDERYRRGAAHVLDEAATAAIGLRVREGLDRASLQRRGIDTAQVEATIRSFTGLLPGLILNIAWLSADFVEPHRLARSPYPPELRPQHDALGGGP